MSYSTREEMRPSEKTLHFIKQFAYTYRSVRIGEMTEYYCLN